eukprot:TRINITY_DN3472_c0_g1_i5.p1 TRINITY_DN3472_c0_g1~~TRINITY_DN3472_c0_g1_i5.p1  ORF type:complete len:313 (-),score=129.76 TRINITY_DN3472_c0_g1_i5:131-1018(-)
MDERSSLLTPSHDSPADHTPPAPNATAARLRQWTYVAVEGEMDSAVEFGLLALIFFNVAALMASTVPTSSKCFGSACERWGDTYEGVFETLEAVSVVVFTIEYFARLWACMEEPAIAAEGPLKGRVTYATRFFLLVDLASILPWWVAVMPGVPESPDFTTALRVFRLFRLLKAEKYISAFGLLAEVLRENSTLLIATSFYAFMFWVTFATLLYLTEVDNPALGNFFQSIPASLFPTLLMLTGEYPLAEFTAKGQVVAGFIAIVAVAVFAVPTAVIGSGFVKAVQRASGQEFSVDM